MIPNRKICFNIIYHILVPLFGLLISCDSGSKKGDESLSGNQDLLKSRRRELIAHGGIKAACTYADYLSYSQYKGNFHCHSYHSDGSQYCDETAEWYYKNGYQILSITDHDAYGDQDGGIEPNSKFQNDTIVHDWNGDGVIHPWVYRSASEVYVRDYSKPAPPWVPRSWQLEKPGKLIILNGIEFSKDRPHTNAINFPEGGVINPHEGWGFVERCHQNSGLVFINHPGGFERRPERFYNDSVYRQFDGLEVMNGFETRDNRSGKNSDGSPGMYEALWDGCLNAGLRLWGFANDDAHNIDTSYHSEWFANAGSAWNMVWAKELTRPAVMEALKAGAFYGSCGIQIDKVKVTPRSITVRSPNATHIKVVGDGGRILKQVDASSIKYTLRGDEKWIRIVLWNDTVCYPGRGPVYTQKAWLQPIILDQLLAKVN